MLLINAKIITMSGPMVENGYVRVSGGKFSQVGSMEERPLAGGEEEVIDIQGKTLVPGFIDAHTHLGLFSSGIGAEGDDTNEDTEPNTPHLRALDGIDPFDPAFADARDAGVTCAVVSPGSANPLAGQVCAVKTAGAWIDDMVVAQPLAIKMALGENPKMTYGSKPSMPATRMGAAALIREQLQKAKRYIEDTVRAQEDEDLEPPEYDVRCEALVPLLNGEIKAHIHAHKAYDITTALRIAEEFGFKVCLVHGTEGHLIADKLAEKNIPVICGPLISARTKPELAGQKTENAAVLAQKGVPVAVSTDHPEIPQEYLLLSACAAAASKAELEPVLRAITIDAAKAVGLEARLGSIEPGKDADLLVFSGDILAMGAKPDMVLIDGCWVENS